MCLEPNPDNQICAAGNHTSGSCRCALLGVPCCLRMLIIDVSRETPDVTTKPKCDGLTNIRPISLLTLWISGGLTQAQS